MSYRWAFGRTRVAACAAAVVVALVGVVGVHGVKRLVVAAVALALVLMLVWLLRISYYAALSADGSLSFRSPLRRASTRLDALTGVTAYKGGGRRYLSFRFRYARGASRIWGREAGAFVDEIVARRPTLDVARKVLPGA